MSVNELPGFGDSLWSQTDYDQFFMRKARAISKQSDDPKAGIDERAAVGAVIVRGNKILSLSANRLPPTLRDKVIIETPDSPDRYVFLEHAERAAIFNAVISKKSVEGATIYCTRFPCADCARSIVYFNLSRIVVAEGFAHETKWIDSQRRALKMMRLASITVRYYNN